MIKILNYINGELIEPINGKYFDNVQSYNGEIYAQIPDSDERDVQEAVISAQHAFSFWSTLSAEKRFHWLMKLANAIQQNFEAYAEAETRDNGKPLTLSRKVDIPRSISNIEFFASAIQHFSSESHFMENSGTVNYTLRRPIGVVGCISPWNLPLYLFTWKIAPALATGNCVVAKPSEITPYTAFLLSKSCIEIGFPRGVLNIIHGYGNRAGQSIVAHKSVKAISFTGGTTTGKHIASTIAPMFKKYSLELGGKNPNIIFADCNWDKMMQTTIRSSFANQGQICLCGSRILVEASVYERFKKEFVERTQKLKIGNPFHEDTDVGAIVSEQHFNKILSCIETAKQEGGNVLLGGERALVNGCEQGFYIQPTIIENLPQHCKTNMEEIFGPVVTLQKFETKEEAIQLANAVDYGLSATVWTENIQTYKHISQRLEAGIVWVNTWLYRDLRTPFGGVKASGVGREGGWEAMRFFTEAKNICVD